MCNFCLEKTQQQRKYSNTFEEFLLCQLVNLLSSLYDLFTDKIIFLIAFFSVPITITVVIDRNACGSCSVRSIFLSVGRPFSVSEWMTVGRPFVLADSTQIIAGQPQKFALKTFKRIYIYIYGLR